MPFPKDVKEQLLVKCHRHCCLCHKFAGNKMEVHHIVHEAQGGDNSEENGIPLCFDCHAEVGAYNPQHTKGNKISPSELRKHKEQWFEICSKPAWQSTIDQSSSSSQKAQRGTILQNNFQKSTSRQFHLHIRLKVFISSTSDLKDERKIAKETLAKLNIDGSQFESWPSSPNLPIEECLKRIQESDAIILLLGSRYGTISDNGISITHTEYRKAKELDKPIFVYILKTDKKRLKQKQFIEEIKNDLFVRFEISLDNLSREIQNSINMEFVRCFRQVHEAPPEKPPKTPHIDQELSTFKLPSSPKEAYEVLKDLYKKGNDYIIHKLAEIYEDNFCNDPNIMNFFYVAEVNLGMEGEEASNNKISRAIKFWDWMKEQKQSKGFRNLLSYNQGNAFKALNENNKAIEKYRESLDEEPNNEQCWLNLGNSYRDLSDYNEAKKCYKKALDLNPLHFQSLYYLSTLKLRHDKNPEAALSYLNSVVPTNLTSIHLASIYGLKAEAYLNMGCYAEGIANIEHALSNAEEINWAWTLAGRLYSLARCDEKRWLNPALSFWKRFLDKHPKTADAWAEFGFVNWFLKEQENTVEYSEQALHAFSKAIELGFEDDGLVWDRIGHLYQENNNWIEAEKAYRKAAQENKASFGYCLGFALMKLGKFEEALPLVKAAAEKHQPDALSWFNVATCLENIKNRRNEAIAAYGKAISLDKNYAEPYFDLGGLFWNIKNYSKAKIIWEKAIKKFPDYARCEEAKECIKSINAQNLIEELRGIVDEHQ